MLLSFSVYFLKYLSKLFVFEHLPDKSLKTVFRLTKHESGVKIQETPEKRETLIMKRLHLHSNFKFKANL